MEEESIEDSESQILQPFCWEEDSNSDIWAMRADLLMKVGNFLEASSRVLWSSSSENWEEEDWEEGDEGGLSSCGDWSFDNGVFDDFFFDFEDMFFTLLFVCYLFLCLFVEGEVAFATGLEKSKGLKKRFLS